MHFESYVECKVVLKGAGAMVEPMYVSSDSVEVRCLLPPATRMPCIHESQN